MVCTAKAAVSLLMPTLTQPALACEVVDAIRHGPAEFLDQEVMHPDFLGFAPRAPCPAGILEVADKLFFLGIDRDHRLARGQCGSHTLVEMHELRVAIRVAVALARLAIGLQTELLLMQQLTDERAANLMAFGDQGRASTATGSCRSSAAATSDRRARPARPVPADRQAAWDPSPLASCRRRRDDGPVHGQAFSTAANSFRPRPIVLAAIPVARATAAIPPYPAVLASVAAKIRLVRSSRRWESAA